MNEPIMIPCEGSGEQANVLGHMLISCTMCGSTFVSPVIIAPKHERPDILAMLKRGDFDQ